MPNLKIKRTTKINIWTKVIAPIFALGLLILFIIIPEIKSKVYLQAGLSILLGLLLVGLIIYGLVKYLKKEDIKSEQIIKNVEYEEVQ